MSALPDCFLSKQLLRAGAGLRPPCPRGGDGMSFEISHFKGRELIDSRGQPALEAEVFLKGGVSARSMAPSGASTGRHEALELRDGDAGRFFGRGLLKAAQAAGALSGAFRGMDASDQKAIDAKLLELDGSPSKSRLGANTILAISLGCMRAAARAAGRELFEQARISDEKPRLPAPLMNIINGGAHGGSRLDIQEFMIAPFGFESFKEALRAGCEIFHQLKSLLKARGLSVSVGDEGGCAPELSSHSEAIELILSAIEACGHSRQTALALDCAASEFYRDGLYMFEGRSRPAEEMISIYEGLARQYPIISIEDGLDEEDWEGWGRLKASLGGRLQIVGDDLLVTQTARVKEAVKRGAANSLLVKCNQVGTLTEALEAARAAKQAGWTRIMSHRSGETEDTSIADLSVAWGAEQIKTGSPCRGERTAKYNRLLRIEEALRASGGAKGLFSGRAAFPEASLQAFSGRFPAGRQP